LEDNIVPYSSPYYDANISSWTGASSTSWATNGNWSGGTAPDQNTLVLLPASATTSVDASGASCYDMSIASGGVLTVTTSGELTITGNLYNKTGSSGLIVQSTSSGNGSLIIDGSSPNDATIQNYVTDGQWHSWCAPVSNLTAEDLYLNASPEVWLTEYDEATKGYTFISALTEPLGDMKGWMLWVGTSTPKTYDFTGPLRSGILGSDNNMVRSQAGDYGFNYVGNPFSSAIDWNSASGWTKTNMNNAIYIFNNGGWTTYINGVGINNGTQYIAMNQGFFVQVTEGFTNGTLKMDNDVCIHNGVGFLKETTTIPDSLICLQVEENGFTDETVIRFAEDATEGFDGNYDAAKFFSYALDRPQIYSTANNMMSINSLPGTVQNIGIDVKGNHGNTMKISATELVDFSNVYLLDELTGIDTDLSNNDYTFTYDQDFTSRFTIHFTITDIYENGFSEIPFHAYSHNETIKVIFTDSDIYNIRLYNLMGQKIYDKENVRSNIDIPYLVSGYYLVKVSTGNRYSVKKVIVN
ncbi:MAG: T9SS type A sorting domain-containing protein, partial [Bacteroidetes bacterium]|nr:T9SS type A sorting domain-containing protein [Bacteroidota bacterium]